MLRYQCSSCGLRIRAAEPPSCCPRCLVRRRGRIEMTAVPLERIFLSRAEPPRGSGRDGVRAG